MEDVLEIIVFLGAALLIVTLIISMMFNWKINKDVSNLQNIHTSKTGFEFDKVDLAQFAVQAHDFWLQCNSSQNKMNMYVYYNENVQQGNLTLQALFDVYKGLSWCHTIQSINQSCGLREDVVVSQTPLPRIVTVTCLAGSENHTLIIQG